MKDGPRARDRRFILWREHEVYSNHLAGPSRRRTGKFDALRKRLVIRLVDYQYEGCAGETRECIIALVRGDGLSDKHAVSRLKLDKNVGQSTARLSTHFAYERVSVSRLRSCRR